MIGSRPGQVQGLLDFWSIVRCARTLDLEFGCDWLVEEPDRLFAGVAGRRDKLIEDDDL